MSSALTAFAGCTPAAPPNTAGAEPPPTPVATSAPAEPPDPATPPDPAEPPVTEQPLGETPTKGMPPLDVPDGVNKIARENYERLAKAVPALHADLDEVEKQVPTCPATDDSCSAQWKKLAESLLTLDRSIGRLGPRCRGSSEDAKAFNQRLEAHQKVIGKRRQDIQKRLTSLIKDDAGKAKWQQFQNEARQAHPVPCLRHACPDW